MAKRKGNKRSTYRKKKYGRGTKSKTHKGIDFATRKKSKRYRTRLPGMHEGHLAPLFPYAANYESNLGFR